MTERIEILLATYQGEKFLEEQLTSIMTQDYPHFTLLARDDGSTDKTLAILEHFAAQYPHKMSLVPNDGRLGAKGNFSMLMAQSNGPYVMLSDQDDVWFPNKISLTYQKMKEMESEYGKTTPLLVHTDLKVVDESLQLTAPSFWSYVNINPGRSHALNRLLAQNVVTGCTVMLNRPLAMLAQPIPQEAIMHDWWIALTAAAFGMIDIVESSTIAYRQHSKNTLGAKKFSDWKQIKEGLRKLSIGDYQKYHQAAQFLNRFRHQLCDHQQALLQAFVLQPKRNWLTKRYKMLKHRFFKNGFLRNAAEFLLS